MQILNKNDNDDFFSKLESTPITNGKFKNKRTRLKIYKEMKPFSGIDYIIPWNNLM